MSDIITTIGQCLEKHNSFLITSHEAGDGDSIGSQLALGLLLQKMHKKVFIFNKDMVPTMYNFLPGIDMIHTSREINDRGDLIVIVLDCGSLARTGLALPKEGFFINIDHHLNNDHYGDLNWVDSRMSSAAEMVYLLWETFSMPMDVAIGTNLYTGILTDTGCFCFSNTTSQCLHIAGHLVETGVNPAYVANQVFERKNPEQLSLLGAALSSLKLTEDGRIASVYLTKKIFHDLGVFPEDTEGIVNYPLSIASVEVALFFKEVTEDLVKISFRSKGKVNVAALAEVFQGGGHHNAAGAKIRGDFPHICEQVLAAVHQHLTTHMI